jgi:hypothetical protein
MHLDAGNPPIVTLAAGAFQLAPRIVSFAVAICLSIVRPVGLPTPRAWVIAKKPSHVLASDGLNSLRVTTRRRRT